MLKVDLPRFLYSFVEELFNHGVAENDQMYFEYNDHDKLENVLELLYSNPEEADKFIKNTQWDEEADFRYAHDDLLSIDIVQALCATMIKFKVIEDDKREKLPAPLRKAVKTTYSYICPHCRGYQEVKFDKIECYDTPVFTLNCDRCSQPVQIQQGE